MPKRKSEPQGWYARAIPEVARFFGVSPRGAEEWLKAGAPGRVGQGYDLSAIAQWLRARYRERVKKQKEQNPDVRWKTYRALRARLVYLREKGAVVPVEQLEGQLLRLAAMVTTAVNGIVDPLADRTGSPDRTVRKAAIQDIADDLLITLSSEYGNKKQTPRAPAAAAKRKPR